MLNAEMNHCDYQDEDYEVEFKIDLEPHLIDIMPHPPLSGRKSKYTSLATDQSHPVGYADEDYEMEFHVNLEPAVIDVVPHNTEEAKDNLTISVALLAVAGAMSTARKLGRR